MAWIETHQALATHRKTLALADELHTSIPAAVGHLICLWTWALDNAPTGDLGSIRAKTIAIAAYWRKRPEDFITALVSSGFLDSHPDGPLRLHDWDEYTGRLTSQRERNKRNQREYRKRLRNDNVSDTSPGTVQNSTEQYRTQHNSSPPNPLKGGNAERAKQGSKRKRDEDALKELPVSERYGMYRGRPIAS